MARSKQAIARSKGIAYEGLGRKWYEMIGLRSFDPSAGSGRIGSDLGLIDLPNIRGEFKNHKAMSLGSWLKQAQEQAEVEGADIGFVQHKRHGVSNDMKVTEGIGNHYVTLKSSDFARILLTLKDNGVTVLSELPTLDEQDDPENTDTA